MASESTADLAIVGAGIAGLAHALAAAKRGLSVVVFDKHEQAIGASLRNFGLIQVVGQSASVQERALKSRAVWLELADQAGFNANRSGCAIIAIHRDEWDVLTEFYKAALDAGSPYRIMEPRETLVRLPMLQNRALRGGLWSQHEIQVEPREAIPAIASYLEKQYGVRFVWGTQVKGVDPPHLETSRGNWRVPLAVVCPGDDFQTLYPALLAQQNLKRCKLQMLRTVPQPRGWRLPCALLSGLSLLHYPGFADCPSLPKLRERLQAARAETLRYGIHLIVCQNSGGDLVLGGSHEYSVTPSPFNSGLIDDLLLQHARALVNIKTPRIAERWSGVYACSPDQDHLILTPTAAVRLVLITRGVGMSIAFALAEEVIGELLGR